jgi:hypothetical protein
VKAALRKDKDITEILSLPKYIFAFLVCAESGPEAGQHGKNILVPYTGKQLCLSQYRNKFFHNSPFRCIYNRNFD